MNQSRSFDAPRTDFVPHALEIEKETKKDHDLSKLSWE